MPRVRFTRHLNRFFPDLPDVADVPGATVAEVVAGLETQFPGLGGYLVDEAGRLRRHVNIFVGNSLIRDRKALSDTVTEADELAVMQALSGGS